MRPWIFLILIIMGVANISNATPVLNNDKSWKWTDGNSIEHTYWAVEKSITWDGAHSDMSLLGHGYYLATITSQAEQDALSEGLSTFYGEFWLGGIQDIAALAPDEGWTWMDTGETFSYTNWKENEPNDYGNGEWHLGTWSNYGWKWNDEHGQANIKGYIIETGAAYVPNPEPATMVLFGFGLIGLAGLGRRLNKNRTGA